MKKITGIVKEGKGKGKKMGFPTINISIKEKMESGVYKGNVFVEKKKYKAAIFVGKTGKILEAYIFDFDNNIYGQEVEVEVEKKIREVMSFSSDVDLIQQIKQDIKKIKK